MRELTLYILCSFFAIASLSSQDCDDKAIIYFDSQNELCGYHGGIKIPMNLPGEGPVNRLLKANDFAYKLSETLNNRRSSTYTLRRDRILDYGKYTDIRYSMIDPNGILHTVSLSIKIDSENIIRSYNISCAQLSMLANENNGRLGEKGIDNTNIDHSESLLFNVTHSKDKDVRKSATDSNNPTSNSAPDGPEVECDPTNVAGFIGVSESPLSYNNYSNCELENNDYIDFQEDHDYIVGAAAGGEGDLLEIRCIENDPSITRIKDRNEWVQSLYENENGYHHSDNHFVFCAQPGAEDIEVQGLYEYTMTYYHLTKTYNYLTNNVIPTANSQSTSTNPFPGIPTDFGIRFDPYNTSLSGIYTVQEGNDNIIINFGAGHQSSAYKDLAEDDLYIVQAGFHAYWKYVLESSPSDEDFIGDDPTDGLLFGAIDYMTWRYSGQTSLLTWGSDPSTFERKMTSSLKYLELLPNPTYQNRGQSFSNALFQIEGATSETVSDFLLYRIMPTMNVSTNQMEAAEMLYNEARMEYEDDNDGSNNGNGITITFEDLCEIEEILIIKYGSELSLSGSADYIIRDSYDGQPFNGEAQGEDIGLEPNTITNGFSKSPDIWNRLSSDPQNDKTHQNPEYNSGAPNFLYVELRTESCNPPDMSGLLHVYIRESHLSGVWPEDWTEGYYDDDPSMPLVGYEITHAEGNPLQSEGVSLSAHVHSYPDPNPDNDWTVYRYEIEWIPFNPLTLPDYNEEGANAWACLLARVVHPDDPMAVEEGSSAWTNNVNNNNIAIRNTSIHHVNGFTGGSNPTAEVLSGLNIISSFEGAPGGGNVDEEVEIEFSVNPGPELVNDEDIFDYIDIEIVMSQEFLDAWEPNGAEGDGFIRINSNTIRITDLDFSIRSILLPPRKHHRIFVRTRNNQEFNQIGFSILLKDIEQCMIGSQEYIVRGSEWENIGNRRDDSDTYSAIPSIDLSPNPVQDMLYVQSKDFDIKSLTIYNQNNEKIVLPIDYDDSRSAKIHVSDLRSGLYILQIKAENKIETRKFIKI